MRISDWSSDVCSSDLFLRITSTESSVTKLASTLNLSVKPKCHMFWACSVSLLRRYLRKRFSPVFMCNMKDGLVMHRRFYGSSTFERKTLTFLLLHFLTHNMKEPIRTP